MPAEARTERNPRSVIDSSDTTGPVVDWSVFRRYDWDPHAPHAVYYLADVNGAYLYIGSSHHPEMRIAQHRKKPWGVEIAGERLEWFPDQATAFAAEKAAIRLLDPRENKAHKVVAGQPASRAGNNTPARPIRIPQNLWTAFGEAVSQSDASDRSAVLRNFMRWYVGEQDARRPVRPSRRDSPQTDADMDNARRIAES